MTLAPPPVPTDITLPLPRLRTLLKEAERDIVVMYESPDRMTHVLRQIDLLPGYLTAARQQRLDVSGEEERAKTLQRRLMRQAPKLVGYLTKSGQAAQLEALPLWQALVEESQRRKSASLRSLITGGGIAGAIFLILFVIIPWIFPPTRTADTVGVIERIQSGDLADALAYAQEQQLQAPEDADNLVWIGVLQAQLGQREAAEASWAAARPMFDREEVFFFERSNARVIVGDLDGAEADARVLIASPELRLSARGYLLLAGAEETRGRRIEALEAYNQAFELAEQAQDAELQVMVRIRMGSLMQSP